MTRLIDRLEQRLAEQFVGREAELAQFEAALQGHRPVLLVHGPAGVGKTSLLQRLAAHARQLGLAHLRIDARDVCAAPEALLGALGAALGLPPGQISLSAVIDAWAAGPRRLLLIDTFEHLAALGPWLREALISELPDDTVVVLAGRSAPDEGWVNDPVWREGVRLLALQALSAQEGHSLLARRGVPPTQCDGMQRLAHGHPLALTLLAELWQTEQRVPQRLEGRLVQQLAQRFCSQAPSPAHRLALEVTAIAQFTRPSMLAALVPEASAEALIDWQCGLGFVESTPRGVFLHDLVREALCNALFEHEPKRAHALRDAIASHLLRCMSQAPVSEVAPLLFESLFPYRSQSPIADFVDFDLAGQQVAVPARPHERADLIELGTRELSSARQQVLRHWLPHPACSPWIVREAGSGKALGCSLTLDLSRVDAASLAADPYLLRIVNQIGRPNPGHHDLVSRLQFAAGGVLHQRGLANAIQAAMGLQWRIDRLLHRAVVVLDEPARWVPYCTAMSFHHIGQLDTVEDDMVTGAFARDCIDQPMGSASMALVSSRRTEHTPLPPQAFDQAVRDLLQHWHAPQAWIRNPLMQSTWVASAMRPQETPAEALRRLVSDAVASLDRHPRSRRFHQALVATFLEPAGTQERAAERLGVPYGTYRYQLATGLKRLCEHLRTQASQA